MHSIMVKIKNSISAQTPHTNFQADWWMGNDVGGAPCSNSPWTPVYISGVKCEANCPTA